MTIAFTTGACKVPFSEEGDAAGSFGGSASASGSASSGRKLFQTSANGTASGDDRLAAPPSYLLFHMIDRELITVSHCINSATLLVYVYDACQCKQYVRQVYG